MEDDKDEFVFLHLVKSFFIALNITPFLAILNHRT